MRDAVKAAFNAFTDRFEGHVSFMYCDVLGLVTTGRGNLIDPMPMALPLPWQKPDGTLATPAEITAEWNRIKGLQSIKMRGGYAYKPYATLFLSNDGIDALCLAKVVQFEGILRGRFPGWDDWCADAQLGVLSMSWAMGAAFNFPAFVRCANSGDWAGAAANCTINPTGNPGVIPRNTANRILFGNAAAVAAKGADPETLFYPGAP